MILSSTTLRRLPVLAVILLAWAVLAVMTLQHPAHGLRSMHSVPLRWPDFALLLFMWWAMAVAMMLPTAIPALDTLEELSDTARRRAETPGRTLYFVLGFVAVWCAFGLVAALLQWQLHDRLLPAPGGEGARTGIAAALFILAGLFQWTPFKHACVSRCRSPMAFFLSCWEEGDGGYWRMGLRMGWFCLGCCWALMLLMFALGIMNLLWMALLALYMYAEKNWVRTPWFDRASGLVLVAAGVFLLLS